MGIVVEPRGAVLRGRLWPGGDAPVIDDGVVVVDAGGRVAALGPVRELDVPPDLPWYGNRSCWVGPGLVDAHVHLAFGSAREALLGGVVAVRDLGAPLTDALRWRTPDTAPPPGYPVVAVAGPILTAPGGYPGNSWGANGFARPVATPEDARRAVAELVAAGVDLIKLALEPAGGQPVPDPATARAVVDAAHEHGLAVTAHALGARMVERALDAGVDELCHMPTEILPDPLVQRLADARVPVVSTLHTLAECGDAEAVTRNAARLVAAGVPVRYGTDLGNEGTRPGAEPRELDRLAAAGLGPLGALRAATDLAAAVPGLRGRRIGRLAVGEPAAAVVLIGDPLADSAVWRRPLVTVADGRWHRETGAGAHRRSPCRTGASSG